MITLGRVKELLVYCTWLISAPVLNPSPRPLPVKLPVVGRISLVLCVYGCEFVCVCMDVCVCVCVCEERLAIPPHKAMCTQLFQVSAIGDVSLPWLWFILTCIHLVVEGPSVSQDKL